MSEKKDFLPLKGIDHVHFWVGNAKQAMFFWWKGFGFQPVAYSGLETGNREFSSYVLRSRQITIVVSSAYSPTSEIAAHHMLHGDGVKAVAFGVDDVESAFKEVVERGAKPVWAPKEEADSNGVYRTAAIQTYGDTIHVFVDRNDYKGVFAPTYEPLTGYDTESTGLAAVDHVVGNVQLGKMNYWVNFYRDVMGFEQMLHFDDRDISTEYSALMSKVMKDGTGKIKMPINEPAEGKKKSQIEEYLDYYYTPGVQHLAFLTDDIIATVSKLRKNGIEFLTIPDTYYELLPKRVGEIKEPLEEIKKLRILVDRDSEGYLLQIFTKPIQERPTFFIEVIQRRGSRGFGKGNFKALFESIELEQARRGNL